MPCLSLEFDRPFAQGHFKSYGPDVPCLSPLVPLSAAARCIILVVHAISQCWQGEESREMLERTPRREAGRNWADGAYANDRRRLSLALVLLLVALVVVVAKDRDYWFGETETAVANETSQEWVPNRVVQPRTAPTAPAPKAKKTVVAAKSSPEPVIAAPPAVAITRAVLPPLEIEVVAGNAHKTVHLSSNTVKVETAPESGTGVEASTSMEQGPATSAAERVPMPSNETQAQATNKAQARPQPIEASYPLLGRQMKVQGSVLLEALIGADGIIRDLRVLSGPAILASAAREAARRWQFKPYLQNGRPVETQAHITVNFTIKVLDNGVKDQMDSVVALSRGGE